MTNEEKINLREGAYGMTHELSLAGTSSHKVLAEEIYGFLSKGLSEIPEHGKISDSVDDGWSGEAVMAEIKRYWPNHLIFNSSKSENSKKEIDWDRPQLLYCKERDRIVETTGRHSGGLFSGRVIKDGYGTIGAGYTGDSFGKDWYEYHGEIPEKTTGLNFLEALKLCKSGKNIRRAVWGDEFFIYSSNFCLYFSNRCHFYTSNMEDMLATDWEIIKS